MELNRTAACVRMAFTFSVDSMIRAIMKVSDDLERPNCWKILQNTTCSHVRTEPRTNWWSTGSYEIKFTDLKTLAGKILANQRSIRQCFPPPTFCAIRYSYIYVCVYMPNHPSVGNSHIIGYMLHSLCTTVYDKTFEGENFRSLLGLLIM